MNLNTTSRYYCRVVLCVVTVLHDCMHDMIYDSESAPLFIVVNLLSKSFLPSYFYSTCINTTIIMGCLGLQYHRKSSKKLKQHSSCKIIYMCKERLRRWAAHCTAGPPSINVNFCCCSVVKHSRKIFTKVESSWCAQVLHRKYPNQHIFTGWAAKAVMQYMQHCLLVLYHIIQ